MGGKSGGQDVTIGFRYYMGVQIIGGHGPVDKFTRLIVGEREAWAGEITTDTTLHVDRPELFGGDDREGGVVGDIDVMMGTANQPRNAYLMTHQGPKCPAYRGLFSLVFKQFLWASGNPYFKSPWIELMRVLKGWENDTPWHPELAVIKGKDMNPAHIIYQSMTDTTWGMGYPASDFDDAAWLVAAQQLFSEDFGLSLEWDQQSDIESFVQGILNHINGSIGLDLNTGKFRLKLIRDDYNLATLLELNVDNIIEMKSFQRAAYGDSANELVVSYIDRDQNAATVAVQDLASIQAQGAVISTTKSYPGIRDAFLASRVGMRDLRTLSSPLAKAVLVTNRILWDKDKGDVVKLNWPLLGIAGAAFRIIDIDKGTLANGAITATLVEDIFGLPAASYVAPPVNQWVDTVAAPIAVNASKVVEAPYWDVVHKLSIANQRQLQDQYGFGLFMASRGAVRSTLNYRIVASPDNTEYSEVGVGHFNPVGNLVSPLTATAPTVTLTGAYDLDNVTLSKDGGYAYIEDECVAVTAIDPSTGLVTIKRGILDTVPSAHAAGVKMFFVNGVSGYDLTERVSGEVVYYKPLPTTGLGTLDLQDATAKMLTLSNRASRPYPPGNLRINGNAYPLTVQGPAFTVSWSHRDRLAQTVDFVDYSVGNIGPEIGTTYRIRVWNGITLLRTYDVDGDTTSWSYPSAHDSADGNLATLRITVNSVRDNIESLYSQGHSFQRLTVSGSVGIEAPPATPTLQAASQPFAINLQWMFGDTRTNIEKVEIRVSDDPAFSNSTVLKYVDYPAVSYLHEIGTALTFKWYWMRVTDIGGQLSPWSNMVWARSASSAVTTQDILDAVMGNIDESALTTSLQSKINTIGTVANIVQAQATTIGELSAQYTVKIDNNGYVTGYGLASAVVDGTPTSEFVIVADKFSIAPVATNKDAVDGSPFFYLTSPTTIGGVAVPAGAYMKDAYIASLNANKLVAGSITADKLAALTITADKIAANTITGDKFVVNTITSDKIDTRGLTIKDAAGNVVFGAGSGVDWSQISGVNKPSDNATVGANAYNLSAQVGGVNLLSNGNFGAGDSVIATGWGPYNNGAYSITTLRTEGGGLYGTSSMRITANVSIIANTFGFYTVGAVNSWTPGLKHTISFYAKSVGTGMVGRTLSAAFSNMGFTSYAHSSPPLTDGVWKRYVAIVVPANNASTPNGELYISWDTAGANLPAGAAYEICGVTVSPGDVPPNWSPSTQDKVGRDNPVTAANASTYIASAAIGAAQIGSIALVGTNNFSVKTANGTGARMEMDSRVIKIFDSNNVLRVKIGDLSA